MAMRAKGITCTVVSATLFGVTPILAKEMSMMGCTGESVVFLRNFFAVFLLWAMLKARRASLAISRRQALSIAWVALVGQAVTTILLYRSYEFLPVGTATTLHFMYPMFVALILTFVYHEAMPGLKKAALAAATVGVLFFMERGSLSLVGVSLALLSGVGFAVFMVRVDKTGLKAMDSMALAFYLSLFTAGYSLAYAFAAGRATLLLPVQGYVYGFAVAAGTSALGSTLLQRGVACIGPGPAAVFCLFEPISSLLAGAVCYGESLGAPKLVGFVLILGSVVAMNKCMVAEEG